MELILLQQSILNDSGESCVNDFNEGHSMNDMSDADKSLSISPALQEKIKKII